MGNAHRPPSAPLAPCGSCHVMQVAFMSFARQSIQCLMRGASTSTPPIPNPNPTHPATHPPPAQPCPASHPRPPSPPLRSHPCCRFWVNFKAWEDVGSVNNLAGSLAFFCALALWATSLTFVRRHFYEVRTAALQWLLVAGMH